MSKVINKPMNILMKIVLRAQSDFSLVYLKKFNKMVLKTSGFQFEPPRKIFNISINYKNKIFYILQYREPNINNPYYYCM